MPLAVVARICGIYLPPEYSDKPHWIYAETMSIAEGMALYMDLQADTQLITLAYKL